ANIVRLADDCVKLLRVRYPDVSLRHIIRDYDKFVHAKESLVLSYSSSDLLYEFRDISFGGTTFEQLEFSNHCLLWYWNALQKERLILQGDYESMWNIVKELPKNILNLIKSLEFKKGNIILERHIQATDAISRQLFVFEKLIVSLFSTGYFVDRL